MGLLAKATAMREQWEKEATLQNTIETPKPSVKKTTHPKLRKIVAAFFAVGLLMHSNTPKNNNQLNASSKHLSNQTKIELEINKPELEKNLTEKINQVFQPDITHSVISEQDRDDLARLIYGEAGRDIHDWIEVLHTVLNRYASPLFENNIHDIVTAKNQYVGYSAKHPVLPEFRDVVDFVINDWETNGCQTIDDCNHYYFITGRKGYWNSFEISPKNSKGEWVDFSKKRYEAPEHYCPTAQSQATRYQLMKKYQATRIQTDSTRTK